MRREFVDTSSKQTVSRKAGYEEILADFHAAERTRSECVSHLTSLGFSRGQARNAVYRYRQRHGLLAS